MNRLNLQEPPDDDAILSLFDESLPRGALDDIGEVMSQEVIDCDPSERRSLVEVTIQKWVNWP